MINHSTGTKLELTILLIQNFNNLSGNHLLGSYISMLLKDCVPVCLRKIVYSQ